MAIILRLVPGCPGSSPNTDASLTITPPLRQPQKGMAPGYLESNTRTISPGTVLTPRQQIPVCRDRPYYAVPTGPSSGRQLPGRPPPHGADSARSPAGPPVTWASGSQTARSSPAFALVQKHRWRHMKAYVAHNNVCVISAIVCYLVFEVTQFEF